MSLGKGSVSYRTRVLVSLSTVLVCSLSIVTEAQASEIFPGALQEQLGMPCAPLCTLCHSTNPGTLGTVATGGKPFGQAMLAAGLVLGREDTLIAALATPQAATWDSDGDGVMDLDELAAGDDPNFVDAQLCDIPRYGCGARVAPREGANSTAAWLAMATALGLLGLIHRRRP